MLCKVYLKIIKCSIIIIFIPGNCLSIINLEQIYIWIGYGGSFVVLWRIQLAGLWMIVWTRDALLLLCSDLLLGPTSILTLSPAGRPADWAQAQPYLPLLLLSFTVTLDGNALHAFLTNKNNISQKYKKIKKELLRTCWFITYFSTVFLPFWFEDVGGGAHKSTHNFFIFLFFFVEWR